MKPRTLVVSVAVLLVAGVLWWTPLALAGLGLGVWSVLNPKMIRRE